jgi:hypothetical protein
LQKGLHLPLSPVRLRRVAKTEAPQYPEGQEQDAGQGKQLDPQSPAGGELRTPTRQMPGNPGKGQCDQYLRSEKGCGNDQPQGLGKKETAQKGGRQQRAAVAKDHAETGHEPGHGMQTVGKIGEK